MFIQQFQYLGLNMRCIHVVAVATSSILTRSSPQPLCDPKGMDVATTTCQAVVSLKHKTENTQSTVHIHIFVRESFAIFAIEYMTVKLRRCVYVYTTYVVCDFEHCG